MSAGVGEARVPQPHRPRVDRPTVPRGPRRVSGPARQPQQRTARAQAATLPAPGIPPFSGKVLEALRRLPDARWLDRMLRGQTWIVVIGVALIGIVAMQVSLLKLNAGIGQSVEKTSALERQNADLRASVSQLSSEERIQQEAVDMGLVMPPAGDVRYVTVRPDEDPGKAVKIMRAPAPDESATTAAATGTVAATATDPMATTTDPTATTDPAATADPTATAAPATTIDPAATATPTTTAAPTTQTTTTPQTTTP